MGNSKPVSAPRKKTTTKTMTKAVLALIMHYADYKWTRVKPEYPETLTLPRFVDKREPHEHKAADCTVMVLGVVMALTVNSHVWTMADYRDGTLQDGKKPWSCPDAWSRATGAPVVTDHRSTPGGVYAVQGLSGLVNEAFVRGTTGHQWIECDGKAWHLSRSKGVLTLGGTVPGYKSTRAVRIG